MDNISSNINISLWLFTRYLILNSSEKTHSIISKLASVNNQAILNKLINFIKNNRLELYVFKLLSEASLEETPLSHSLMPYVRDALHKMIYRDKLLSKTINILESLDIDYVIFKTFNKVNSIGVDIDLLIDVSNYREVVEKLLRESFRSIDSLNKTYETGFMFKGNPIILDLHTKLAVLGIPYLSHELLLKNRIKIIHKAYNGDRIEFYSLPPLYEALTRMAHAIIKESKIKLDDITETFEGLRYNSQLLRKLADEEGLSIAYNIYINRIIQELRVGTETYEGLLFKFTEGSERQLPPYSVPRIKSLLSLLNRVRKFREEVYLIQAIKWLKYKRVSSHIGAMLLNYLNI